MKNPAVHYDAGSNSGSEAGVKDVTVAAACSPQAFRKRSCVGIVVEFRGDSVAPFDFGNQRKITPAGNVGRIQHHSRPRIKWARRANADWNWPVSPGMVRKNLVHNGGNGSESFRRGASRIHGSAQNLRQFAALVDESTGNFRAA